MIETVRPATAEDVPVLARLAADAVVELSVERGGAIWSVHEARFAPFEASIVADLDDGSAVVLAAAVDDVVVGYGVARVVPLTDGTALGRVTDIVVDPARGVGMGELLLDGLVAWCEARDCVGVDAFALPGARETKNFFEGNGFSARALILHHSLRTATEEPPEHGR